MDVEKWISRVIVPVTVWFFIALAIFSLLAWVWILFGILIGYQL